MMFPVFGNKTAITCTATHFWNSGLILTSFFCIPSAAREPYNYNSSRL
jgi:hypothetical protein